MTYCELRTGRLPFEADNVCALIYLRLNAPPDLTFLRTEERPVLARALAKEPNDRWPSCRAFVEALRASRPASKSSFQEALTAVPSEAPGRRASRDAKAIEVMDLGNGVTI